MVERKKFTSRKKHVANRTIAPGNFTESEKHMKAAHVCVVCEEGGDLWFCDGPCKRHFHTDETSKGVERYSCTVTGGTMLVDGRWKCLDCMLGQAKCFGVFSLALLRELMEGHHCWDNIRIHYALGFTALSVFQLKPTLVSYILVLDAKNQRVILTVWYIVWGVRRLGIIVVWKRCRRTTIARIETFNYTHIWQGETRYMFYCEHHLIHSHVEPRSGIICQMLSCDYLGVQRLSTSANRMAKRHKTNFKLYVQFDQRL